MDGMIEKSKNTYVLGLAIIVSRGDYRFGYDKAIIPGTL